MDTSEVKSERDGGTESWQLQTLRSQRIANIRTLISQLGHDLRQPLSAIRSNAQAALRLLDGGAGALQEIREILNDIILDEKRTSGFIGEIAEKLRHDRQVRTDIHLSQIVREALDFVHGAIEGQGIRAAFNPESDCVVSAETSQIRQVILELVTNSIEAMSGGPDHPRRLEIQLATASPDMAKVTVRDSGPGVPAPQIPKLFSPFQTTKDSAAGLGLFFCRAIIQSHGGTILHLNSPDEGATFCFTLPLSGAMAQGISASISNRTAEGGAKKVAVLLVDDSEPYRRATWSVLSKLPSLVLAGEAVDGLEAVEKAENLKPDLILMDISLSGINGIDAATQIRKVSPDSKIMFLSQYDDPDIIRAVLLTGALGYVLKIDSAKDLESAVNAVSRGLSFLSSGIRPGG
jgi:CheY-like chemotaxis protein